MDSEPSSVSTQLLQTSSSGTRAFINISTPLLSPPPTPSPLIQPIPRTGVLIEGLNPPPPRPPTTLPPTAAAQTNREQSHPPRPRNPNSSAIVNHPRRFNHTHRPPSANRRCLLHLIPRCPICFNRNHNRNPRFLRQEGIRAILALIRDVFGVNLNPRELSLFIAGFYA